MATRALRASVAHGEFSTTLCGKLLSSRWYWYGSPGSSLPSVGGGSPAPPASSSQLGESSVFTSNFILRALSARLWREVSKRCVHFQKSKRKSRTLETNHLMCYRSNSAF
jgi:hypothetical protein